MNNEISPDKLKEMLLNLFRSHFESNKLSISDSFDQSAFFLKHDQEYFKNITNLKFFQDLIQANPSESHDIVKLLLVRALVKSRQNKIKTDIFVEEIVDAILRIT